MSGQATQNRESVRLELLQYLRAMEYAAFEQVMKSLLYQSGYVAVEFIGRTHKRGRTPRGGIDLTAHSTTDLSTILTVVQIKQYERVVSRRFVDELRGAMLRQGAEQGLLVTLSRFSKVAHAAALESNVAPIKLIEGCEVLDLLFSYRIGVLERDGEWKLDIAYLDSLKKEAIGTYTKAPKRINAKLTSEESTLKIFSSPNKSHENETQNTTKPASYEKGGMTWNTHVMAGLSSLWIIEELPTIHQDSFILIVGAAAFGALLPDLDAPRSKISQMSFGGIKPFLLPAQAVNRVVGHRSLLHSLLALVYVALAGAIVAPFIGWQASLGLWLGYASHLATDACTRSGIPFLYPKPKRFHLLPKQLRIVTGSMAEEFVFVALAISVLILLFAHLSI